MKLIVDLNIYHFLTTMVKKKAFYLLFLLFFKENYGLKLYICTSAVTTKYQSHIKACTFLLLLNNKTTYISIYEGNETFIFTKTMINPFR